MKILQKIAAIIYAALASYRCYVLIITAIYSASVITIGDNGVYTTIRAINLTVLFIAFVVLSLLVSSALLVWKTFSKKVSINWLMGLIISIIINAVMLVFVPTYSYQVSAYAILGKITVPFIYDTLSILTSLVIFVIISLANILLLTLKIRRENE